MHLNEHRIIITALKLLEDFNCSFCSYQFLLSTLKRAIQGENANANANFQYKQTANI